jgi:hypothetical protein
MTSREDAKTRRSSSLYPLPLREREGAAQRRKGEGAQSDAQRVCLEHMANPHTRCPALVCIDRRQGGQVCGDMVDTLVWRICHAIQGVFASDGARRVLPVGRSRRG